jgi:hypothetical protein
LEDDPLASGREGDWETTEEIVDAYIATLIFHDPMAELSESSEHEEHEEEESSEYKDEEYEEKEHEEYEEEESDLY